MPASTSSPRAMNASHDVVSGAVGAAQHDDLLECGHVARAADELDVVGVEEVGDGEEHARACGAQDVGRFVALEAGVERHHDRAAPVRAFRGEDPLGDVVGPDRDPVAGLDAGGDQRRGRPVDLLDDLDPGEPELTVDECLRGPELLRGAVEDARDGAGQGLVEVFRCSHSDTLFIRL